MIRYHRDANIQIILVVYVVNVMVSFDGSQETEVLVEQFHQHSLFLECVDVWKAKDVVNNSGVEPGDGACTPEVVR